MTGKVAELEGKMRAIERDALLADMKNEIADELQHSPTKTTSTQLKQRKSSDGVIRIGIIGAGKKYTNWFQTRIHMNV